MAANTIEEVLSWAALSRPIQAVKPGIPDLFPDFRSNPQRYRGKGARAVVVKGTRRTAQRVEYGSPAVRRAQLGIDEATMVMLHSFHELEPFDWLLLQRLRGYDTYESDRAVQEIARQLAAFGDLFENLERAAVALALVNGTLWFDANGNLLPSSSGAVLTVNYGIPAGNQGQLGGIISASWAVATTDISAQLRKVVNLVQQATGYVLTRAYYGQNIPSYLFNNATLQNYFVRNPEMNQRFTNGDALGRGLGFDWRPLWQGFFEDFGGNINQIAANPDTVVFTPEPSLDWYEWSQGSFGVPRDFGPTADVAAALGKIEEVWGRFGYALPQGNPPGAVAFAGDTFLPWIKLGTVVVQADTTP